MFYCFFKHRRKGRTPRLYWPCQYIQGSGPLKEHKQIIKKPSKIQRNSGNDFSSIFGRFLEGFWGGWALVWPSKHIKKSLKKIHPIFNDFGDDFDEFSTDFEPQNETQNACKNHLKKIKFCIENKGGMPKWVPGRGGLPALRGGLHWRPPLKEWNVHLNRLSMISRVVSLDLYVFRWVLTSSNGFNDCRIFSTSFNLYDVL